MTPRPMTAISVPQSVDRRLVAVDVAIKVATVGLLAWAVLNPDLPQFTGKAFIGRAVVYPIALLILPAGWWVFDDRVASRSRSQPTSCSGCRS